MQVIDFSDWRREGIKRWFTVEVERDAPVIAAVGEHHLVKWIFPKALENGNTEVEIHLIPLVRESYADEVILELVEAIEQFEWEKPAEQKRGVVKHSDLLSEDGRHYFTVEFTPDVDNWRVLSEHPLVAWVEAVPAVLPNGNMQVKVYLIHNLVKSKVENELIGEVVHKLEWFVEQEALADRLAARFREETEK